jgi:hypothetical protein
MRARDTIRTNLAILAAVLMAIPAAAQTPRPALTMTVDRTVVAPGDTIKVTVASPANASLRGVMLVGTAPIGIVGFSERLPASFEVKIGPDALLGKHGLSAIGKLVSGEELVAHVEIAVERGDLPESIEPAYGFFEATQGSADPVGIFGMFPDGRKSLNESAALRLTSANPRIVRIDDMGWVQAISPGTTTVTATYTVGARSQVTTVRVTVRRPSFSVSPTPFNFGRRIVGTSSMTNLTLTNTSGRLLTIEKVTAMAHEEELRSTDDCATGIPLAVGATCTISVVFTPRTIGETLRFIRVNTADYEEVGFAVLVTGVPAKSR